MKVKWEKKNSKDLIRCYKPIKGHPSSQEFQHDDSKTIHITFCCESWWFRAFWCIVSSPKVLACSLISVTKLVLFIRDDNNVAEWKKKKKIDASHLTSQYFKVHKQGYEPHFSLKSQHSPICKPWYEQLYFIVKDSWLIAESCTMSNQHFHKLANFKWSIVW